MACGHRCLAAPVEQKSHWPPVATGRDVDVQQHGGPHLRRSLRQADAEPLVPRRSHHATSCRLLPRSSLRGEEYHALTLALLDQSSTHPLGCAARCRSVQWVSSQDDKPVFEPGVAGASARRRYDRLKANREKDVRDKHPRLGGLLLSLQDEPRHQRAWLDGAGGEERVARFLAKHLRDDARVLHDRRIPRTRANVDHIAVAPSGIWVIDTKRYQGRVAIRKLWLRPAKLTIAGRDKTRLVESLDWQVGLVKAAALPIAPSAPSPRRSVFCRRRPPASPRPLLQRLSTPAPQAAFQTHQCRRPADLRGGQAHRGRAGSKVPGGVRPRLTDPAVISLGPTRMARAQVHRVRASSGYAPRSPPGSTAQPLRACRPRRRNPAGRGPAHPSPLTLLVAHLVFTHQFVLLFDISGVRFSFPRVSG